MNISLRLNDLNKLKGLFLLFLLVKNFQLCSQVCSKPGLLDPNNSVSGVVNTYYPPSSSSQTVIAGSTSISLGSVPSGFGTDAIAIGDLLLIIQMQDATINTSNISQYGSGATTAGLDGLGGTGASSIGNSGKYEYIVATSNVSTAGGVLTFTAYSGLGLVNTYRQALTQGVNGLLGRKTFQVIRVPQYSSIMLTGNITSPAFNGTVGGIVVMDIAGLLNFNGFLIDVSEKGFRGGFSIGTKRDTQTPFPSYANSYTVNGTSISPSGKGEGIAGTPKDVFDGMNRVIVSGVDGYPGGDLGRGAPANAGGGGDDHNAGGGGGANGGYGGNGGWGIYNVGSVTQPTSNPNYYTYDSRGRFGTKYFSSVTAPIGLLCLGGGGGAGQRDNMTSSDGNPAYDNIVGGGPGGGIVIVRAGKVTGNGSIISNGKQGVAGNKFLSAACSCNSCNGGGIDLTNVDGVFIPQSSTGEWCLSDGASGGGAGGSVFFYVENNSTGANISINTRGGNGGNTNTWLNEVSSIGHGPGGGGGGGVIQYYCPGATITNNANGGIAGVNLFNSNSKGATAGASGSVVNFNPLTDFLTVPQIISNSSLCFPNLQTSKIEANPGAPGSRPAGSIATYTLSITNTGGSTANLVSLIDNLSSYFIYNVGSATVSYMGGATGPAAGPIAPTSLSPLTFNSFTIPVGGIVNVVFSITTSLSTPSGIYQNGAYSSYLDPTRTIIGSLITPSLNATAGNLIYQGTGATVLGSNYNGTSSGPVNEDVYICATPTINVTSSSSFSICNGSSVILTAVGASSYTWSNGAITNTISVSPTSTTNYSIVGFDSGCSGTRNLTINVNPLPTITVVPSSAAICSGATATLTAGGASTYTWTSGPVSATYPVNTAGVYTVTGTNSNGCVNTRTVSLTVNSLPVVTAIPSTTAICSGATATLTAGGASTYTWTSGPVSATYPVNAAGIYTVTGTNSNGCVNTRTVSLTVNPLPTITAAPSSAAICTGATATLTASGASTYIWTSGPASATYPVNTAGVYTVTGTDVNNCVNTRTVSLTVNPLPAVTAIPSSAAICSGSTATLTAGGASTYTWTSSPVSATYPVSTAGVYTVTGTNSNGCVNTRTVSLTVNSLPTITAAPSSASICSGSTATLTAGGASTYTWTSGPVSATYPVSTAGIYTVTGTNSNGCVNTRTVSVTVNPNPSLTTTAGGLLNVSCLGSATGSLSTTASGTSGYSYVWSPSVSTSNVATGLNAGVYTTTVTDVNGCRAVLSNTISAPSASLATAVATRTTGCGIANGSATVTPSGGWSSSYTYTWSSGASTSNTATGLLAGAYTATVTDANGCKAIQIVNIVNPTTPTLTVSASSSAICSGNSSVITPSLSTSVLSYSINGVASAGPSFTVNPSATSIYNINATDVSNCVSNLASLTITVNATPTLAIALSSTSICVVTSATLTPSGASSYTLVNTGAAITTNTIVNPTATTIYTVSGTSAAGCLGAQQTINLAVNALPNLTLSTSSNTICAGNNATLTANGADTYSWTSGPSDANYIVNPTATTVYEVIGTNTVTTCNSAISQVTITVNSVPTVTANSSPSTVCSNGSINLTAIGATTYTWSGTGITSSNENSVNPIFAAPTASTYIYNLVGANSDDCLSSISTVTVDVIGAPSSSLAIANQIICIGTTGVFEIANPQSGVAYTWNSVSTGTNYSVGSPITNTAGNYTINVVAMLGAGSNTCATTSTGTLTVNELPTVTIDQTNLTLCDGEQATISIVNPLPAPASYAWSYNNSIGNSLTLSNLEAGLSGNYTVTVNDGNGCSNQTTFELVVNACGVFIPELFSPNGDNQNDAFVIKNIDHYPNNHVLIYNRWGNLVYEKNGYNNDWKGTNDKADGKILPAGTYFIILDFGDNGKTPIYKGYIMLEY